MSTDIVVAELKRITPENNNRMLTAVKQIKDSDVEQISLPTNHFLYAGCYVRTCLIKKGTYIGSCLVKIPTVVIISGKVVASDSEHQKVYNGYHVLRGEAFRRAFWFAQEDTYITMVFACKAKNATEATKEFTDEWEALFEAEEY